jgi:seryl-tRNA synthetase
MLDIEYIRENKEKVKKGVAAKQFDDKVVDEVLALDEKRRSLIKETEELRAERNKAAKEKNIEKGKEVKKKLQEVEPKLKQLEEDFYKRLNLVPNIPSEDVKIGKGEEDNEELRKWGEIKKFDFKPKDHLELGKELGIISFEDGAKVAGSQFYYLFGDGALLELALIQFAFDTLSKEGFTPVITPDVAKSRYYLGTGYAPRGNEAQTYTIEDEDLGLIATAEVTLAGKHADEVLQLGELPKKYVGYSHCFRKEEGSYGKYSKGMYRVHQFSKAEMFVYTTPTESNKMHDYLLKMEEDIYQKLGIPYRVLKQCTGDLGAMAARKYDIEAWMPGRGDYGEVTSTSNCTDYQARNLNIKYRKKDGTNEYIHMLNGTAIATSRTPVAILENYQQKDGSVEIPEVLQKYMGKKKMTPNGI